MPPSDSVNAPPMVHSTTINVVADKNAETTPVTKSTGASVATRRVLGNAVFRIGVIALDKIELIVTSIGEPACDHRVGQPLPPQTLNAHAGEHLQYAHDHTADGERKEGSRQPHDSGGVLLLEVVEDRAVPDIDAVLEATASSTSNRRPPVATHANRLPFAPQKPRALIQKRFSKYCLRTSSASSGDNSGSDSTSSGGGGSTAFPFFGNNFLNFLGFHKVDNGNTTREFH